MRMFSNGGAVFMSEILPSSMQSRHLGSTPRITLQTSHRRSVPPEEEGIFTQAYPSKRLAPRTELRRARAIKHSYGVYFGAGPKSTFANMDFIVQNRPGLSFCAGITDNKANDNGGE
jgi:hypothetical protein